MKINWLKRVLGYTDPNPPKCIDCKWSIESKQVLGEPLHCSNEEVRTNKYSGEVMLHYPYCAITRMPRQECGPSGKYYEGK